MPLSGDREKVYTEEQLAQLLVNAEKAGFDVDAHELDKMSLADIERLSMYKQ